MSSPRPSASATGLLHTSCLGPATARKVDPANPCTVSRKASWCLKRFDQIQVLIPIAMQRFSPSSFWRCIGQTPMIGIMSRARTLGGQSAPFITGMFKIGERHVERLRQPDLQRFLIRTIKVQTVP